MIQKVIKIGSSLGVTIPKKQLKELGIAFGDNVELNIKPVKRDKQDAEILQAARKILADYKQDFENLAKR